MNNIKSAKILLNAIIFFGCLFLIKKGGNFPFQKTLGVQTQVSPAQQKIIYWEQVVNERPDYRDGWLQLATAYYQTGNRQKAKVAIEKAKELDSDNQVVLNLEKLIGE